MDQAFSLDGETKNAQRILEGRPLVKVHLEDQGED
jgi:hypothetical protein